jgi:hypothetical protein
MASSPCAVMDTPRRAPRRFVLLRERSSAPGPLVVRVASPGPSLTTAGRGAPLRREAKNTIAPFPVTRRIYFRGLGDKAARRAIT